MTITTSAFSQVDGKIFFRNGNVFEGQIEIDNPATTGERPTNIHYFPNKNTQLTKGFSDIYKVEAYRELEGKKDTLTYFFKKFKNKELFLVKLQSYKNFEVFLGRELNSTDVPSSVGFISVSTGKMWFEDVFYIGKKYSFRLEKLHRRVGNKKFKALLLKYASECKNVDELVSKYKKNKKLNNRELFKELVSSCE